MCLYTNTLDCIHDHYGAITKAHSGGYFTAEVDMSWRVYEVHKIPCRCTLSLTNCFLMARKLLAEQLSLVSQVQW